MFIYTYTVLEIHSDERCRLLGCSGSYFKTMLSSILSTTNEYLVNKLESQYKKQHLMRLNIAKVCLNNIKFIHVSAQHIQMNTNILDYL